MFCLKPKWIPVDQILGTPSNFRYIVERKIRFQILTFPGSIQICPAESAWLFGVSAIINSIPSNSTKTAWTLKESFSQAFNLFWKRALQNKTWSTFRAKSLDSNYFKEVTRGHWSPPHLSGCIRCFVSWLAYKQSGTFDMVNKIESKLCDWSFSEGLGVYFWNINLRMWLIERTNKTSWFLNIMENSKAEPRISDWFF